MFETPWKGNVKLLYLYKKTIQAYLQMYVILSWIGPEEDRSTSESEVPDSIPGMSNLFSVPWTPIREDMCALQVFIVSNIEKKKKEELLFDLKFVERTDDVFQALPLEGSFVILFLTSSFCFHD